MFYRRYCMDETLLLRIALAVEGIREELELINEVGIRTSTDFPLEEN